MSVSAGPAPSGYEQRRADELRRWKRRASGFLLAALAVFITSHLIGDEAGFGGLIRAASEAALIGGIADWFAVTALFRHPLGIPIPHTALIPRSKDEIGRSLGEFVHRNFLDPANLREWLAQAGISRRVGEWFADPDHAALAARRGLETAVLASESLDEQRLTESVTDASLAWLRQTPVAPMFAVAVEASVREGRHHQMIEAAARAAEVVLSENAPFLRERFRLASPWWVPAPVDEMVFRRVTASFRVLISEVAADPRHPLRAEIADLLVRFAAELRTSPQLAETIEESKRLILDSPEVSAWILSQWELVRDGLGEAAATLGSEIEKRVAELIRWWAERVLADPELRRRLDGWIAAWAGRVSERWGDEITQLIEATVARWDAAEISHRLELQLGPDLQFVRINGTVVGGLVGVAIHLLLLVFA